MRFALPRPAVEGPPLSQQPDLRSDVVDPLDEPVEPDEGRGRRIGALVGRTLLVVGAVPVVLLVLLVAAWAVDTRAHEGEVARNTTLAGTPIGGYSAEELRPVVAAVGQRWADAEVAVNTPADDLVLRGPEMGLAVDQEATIADALDVGRTGTLVTRPFRWLGAVVSPRSAPLRVDVDEATLAATLVERDPTDRRPPVEPSIALSEGELVAVEGQDGRGLGAPTVAEAVREAAVDGDLPLRIEVEPGPLPPELGVEHAQLLAELANARTAVPLAVALDGAAGAIPSETVRTWLGSRPTETGLELVIDEEQATADLEAAFADVGREPVDATFTVAGGAVQVVPGRLGTACCAPEAPSLLLEGIVEPGPAPVRVPLREVEPERTAADARELGVTTPIASFTTNHAAGQGRVTNIHRIADLTRGVLIEPGETFSVNDFVGRRTREKGFVPAGVIYNGEFTDDVGGGISQYATTLFNAAFFGGLDFEEYQSHSIYISRYPYGREATLSYPNPDLEIRNTTPYGVLIWPTYTPSSITVTLYSTPYARGEQTGQTQSAAGACTRVTTQRTRTYTDGRRAVDEVYALYRPAEGVNCR